MQFENQYLHSFIALNWRFAIFLTLTIEKASEAGFF
jgi:hypothetical protein